MKPNFAGVLLGKRRFKFVQMRFIIHREGLLGNLRGRGNEINNFLFKTINRNATLFTVQHHYDI